MASQWKGVLIFSVVFVIIVLGIYFYSNSHSNISNSNSNTDNQQQVTQAYCGDGTCNNGETCSTCSSDCGQCQQDVKDKIKNNIVWVKYTITGKNQDGTYFENEYSGSGVIYYTQGTQMQVFTNRHVIDCSYSETGCYQRLNETVQVRTQDGIMHSVSKVSIAPHGLDMALLDVNVDANNNYSPAYVRKGDINIGETVTAIGYPSFAKGVLEFSVSDGTVTNFRDLMMNDGFAFKAIDSDAYTYFGSSGGGLFDKDGNLVGINTWLANTQTSIAVKISVIDNFGSWSYCQSGYSVGDKCYNYCNRDEILGTNGGCYKVCGSEFYCETNPPQANDPRCQDPSYVLGNDGSCHQPCGQGYCPQNSYCFKNTCIHCPDPNTVLWRDGTCRAYQ